MFARTTLAAALIASLTLLGACSDDADDKDPKADPSSSVPDGSGEHEGAKTRDCKVTAELTDAATASWEGQGRAITGNTSGPEALYQFTKGKDSLSLYSSGEGFEPSAVVTIGGATYSTEAGASGLDVST